MTAFNQAINQGLLTALNVAGVDIAYTNNVGNATTNIIALVGKSTHEISTAMEVLISESRDYIFPLQSCQFVPKKGDVIVEGNCKHKVYSPSGQNCFEYHTPDKTWVRVHTELVGTV